MQAWAQRLMAAHKALGDRYAAAMEAEAKNPPYPLRPLREDEGGTWTRQQRQSDKGPYKWRDKLTHARPGIFGEAAEFNDNTLRVRVAHTMEYGVYLELANSGKYAILEPTVKRHAPDFFRDAERIVKGR